jgi:hypothetical protein
LTTPPHPRLGATVGLEIILTLSQKRIGWIASSVTLDNGEMSGLEIIGISGVVGTFYFGIRSMFQSSDFEALQRALRANSQGLYNNLWRIGGNAEDALKTVDLVKAQQLARGIADMSQTARHTLVAFSKEHAHFSPFYEPAWEPKPVSPEAQRSWRRLFFRL